MYNKGYALHNIGRYDQAIECYDKAIELDPNDVAEWYNKGGYLIHLGKHKDAIECCDKAMV